LEPNEAVPPSRDRVRLENQDGGDDGPERREVRPAGEEPRDDGGEGQPRLVGPRGPGVDGIAERDLQGPTSHGSSGVRVHRGTRTLPRRLDAGACETRGTRPLGITGNRERTRRTNGHL